MIDGPVTNRRFSRLAVRRALIMAAGAITVIGIVLGAWYLYKTSSQSAVEQAKQQLEDSANAQAGSLAGFFAVISGQLAALASDESIIQLFERADSSELSTEADNRLASFQSGLKLRFLIPGHYDLDNESSPPLSYASLDILNSAETSTAAIAADVLLFGSDSEHIVMAERVNNQAGELIGLIHLSLAVVLFEQALASLSPGDAYLELQQPVAGKRLLLGAHGDAAMRVGEPYVTSVNGTRWRMAYWQGNTGTIDGAPQADPAESGSLTTTIVSGILVVCAIAGLFLFIRSRRSADEPAGVAVTDKTEVVYGGAIKAIMDGMHPGLEKLIPNLAVENSDSTPVAGISRGMVGDDVTMFSNPKGDVKAVEKQNNDIEQTAQVDSEAITQPKAVASKTSDTPQAETETEIAAGIFRTYDIRGVVGKELTVEAVYKIGQSIGSEAAAKTQKTIIVGRDGRTSSPELSEALIKGLRAAGRDVIDIGMVPTPVLYFATHLLEPNSGVMLTGSHNGPEYNGLKIVLAGNTLSEGGIKAIYDRIQQDDLETGQGGLESQDVIADYIRRISEDIPVVLSGAFKLVVDCGNGVAGAVAPQLYKALGHDVIELYCEVDGNFPNHHPDPSQPENLQTLIDKVKEEQADLGFAFDGDADRLGVVDSSGNIIWPDRQMMLLARDVLSRNEGAEIIYDVKCSRYLKTIIEDSGGKALMWKTGHSLIKGKMKEIDSPLAGEMSGHIFFKERWYGFDDALYAGARLLEVLVAAGKKPAEVFAEMPEGVSTPELRVDLPEAAHKTFMDELGNKIAFDDAEISDIDGYRVEFPDGWGLVRPSNTTPCLVLRFEADDQEALARIQSEFSSLLLSINSDLSLPF